MALLSVHDLIELLNHFIILEINQQIGFMTFFYEILEKPPVCMGSTFLEVHIYTNFDALHKIRTAVASVLLIFFSSYY